MRTPKGNPHKKNRHTYACLIQPKSYKEPLQLKHHNIIAPKAIRQNEIVTAGTLSKNLATIGDVLTDSIAIKSKKNILEFN